MDKKIKHDEYRLKSVTKLKDKLRPTITEKKQHYMDYMKEKNPISMEEFDFCCFTVTTLCTFEKFLNSPWAFLEITEGSYYILQIEDLKMMLSNPEFCLIDKYLCLCVESKSIVPLSDMLIRDSLIDALDMVLYKKNFKRKKIKK